MPSNIDNYNEMCNLFMQKLWTNIELIYVFPFRLKSIMFAERIELLDSGFFRYVPVGDILFLLQYHILKLVLPHCEWIDSLLRELQQKEYSLN